MLLRFFIILIFSFISIQEINAQEDSLLGLIPNATEKQKANIYRQLAENNLYKSNNKFTNYASESIKFSEKTNYTWCKAYVLRLWGIHEDIHGNYKSALEKINTALELNRSIQDKEGISACLSSLGIIYFNQSKYDKALEVFLEVITYYEGNDQAYNKSLTISNIAGIYKYQGDLKNAIYYYRQAYYLMKQDGDVRGLGISANNLGMAFFTNKDYDSASYYMNQGLELKKKTGDKRSVSFSLSNLSQLYEAKGDYEKAAYYLEECVKIQTEMGDKKGMATSMVAAADLLAIKNPSDPNIIKNYTEAYATAKEIGDVHLCQLSSYKAAVFYYDAKDFKNAAEYMYVYTIHKDSLISAEKAKSFAEMQTRFDTERKEKEIALLNQQNAKKELELSVANNERMKRENELELLGKEKQMQGALLEKANAEREAEIRLNEMLKKDKMLQAEKLKMEEAEKEKLNIQNKKKEQQIYAFAIGSILLIGLLFFVVRGYRQKRKANQLLETQNAEILKQKEEIVFKNEIIEEKNRDVMSSITYAKRLQDAILPSSQIWNSLLPDSFILYLPKDIVAGDFYFIEKIDELIIVTAADCTGHGVPGAMVSVVCSNAMNRVVKEFKITDPGKILDKVRELVLETFKNSEGGVKDGMDISLAVIDTKNNQLKWSGANNPLLILRLKNEIKEWIEITADKQPIGFVENPKPFTTHEVQLEKGDIIYLFTDGYADQFGGEKGKKLKYTNMKKLFEENSYKSLPEIKMELYHNFQMWKGDLEQVDDVCIVGIRI